MLWIGMYTNENVAKKLGEYNYKPLSIATAQKSLIEGLKYFTSVDTLSGARLPSARSIEKVRLKGEKWIDGDGSKHHFVDLLNIKYLEIVYKAFRMSVAAKEWARQCEESAPFIFVYGLHLPYLLSAKKIKKIIPMARIITIVPDLPQYYDFDMSLLKKTLKKIDWHIMKKQMRIIDGFVLFSKAMADFLNIEEEKFIVVEGSYNTRENEVAFSEIKKENSESISVLYTGNLRKGYGIEVLLDAFKLIKREDIELWIAGSGNLSDLIIERSKEDKRIKFFGFISDKEQLLKLQRNATMLISSLPPENIASRYCFPSKLFEYMYSGNPTLAFKLEGIPEEYYEYITPMPEYSAQAVADTIEKVGSLSPEKRKEVGEKARRFIIEEKTNIKQSERMLNFARNLA